MFKSISMHTNDTKGTVKFDFVTSYLAFRDSIPINFILEVVASLQQDNSITMLAMTKDRMFMPIPWIQETTSTTNSYHNRYFKNLKVLSFENLH